jgi:DNA-binding transcriptional regulator LsrR (DeoR family)
MSDTVGNANLVQELLDIKKLLILQSLALGYQQRHLAATLGVSEATLSRMLPRGLPKISLGSGS